MCMHDGGVVDGLCYLERMESLFECRLSEKWWTRYEVRKDRLATYTDRWWALPLHAAGYGGF